MDVAVDLSQEGEWVRKTAVEPPRAPPAGLPLTDVKSSDQVVPTQSVCLLQATKILPRHKKLVQIRITGLKNVPTSLFEPDLGKANEVGVAVTDAIVEADHGNCITSILENLNSRILSLKKGLKLGTVEPIDRVIVPKEQADRVCQYLYR